jgi:hypothetical protein
MPIGYVEAYGSRAGFVLPPDRKIILAHSVRLYPKLHSM